MDSLEKSKGDKQNEENTERDNSGPSRQTEISESDDHEDDNIENEGPGPSSQTSVSCTDKRKDSPRKRKIEDCSANLKKEVKLSRIEKDASVDEQFPCQYCEAKFPSMESVRKHSAKKHKEHQPHTCYKCPSPKRFNSSYALRLHEKRNHEGKMEHECEICGKQFYIKEGLTIHLTMHHNEQNFVCDFCPKAFKNIYYRNKHMKIHTRKEEDKYECDVCGKHFFCKRNMKRHKQKEHPEEDSPTNEQRDHSLEEIDAQLTTHENERNFVCDFCSKTFNNRDGRNAHMKIHTRKEEDKYECDVCGKRFCRKQSLKRHKQKEHPEEDSPTYEQRDHSLEKIDAQLTATVDDSTMTFHQEQDLQLQKRVDLKQQENDSQESQRDMLDEKLEHDNDPEMQNFILHYYHNQNEVTERIQDSQSDNDVKFEHPDNQFILYDSSQKKSNSPKRIEHSEENIPLNQQDECVGLEMDPERQRNEESKQNMSQYETEPELYNQPCEDVYQFGKLDFNDLILLYEEQHAVHEQCQNVCGSRMENAQPSTSGMNIDKWHKCQICVSHFAREQDWQVHMELH